MGSNAGEGRIEEAFPVASSRFSVDKYGIGSTWLDSPPFGRRGGHHEVAGCGRRIPATGSVLTTDNLVPGDYEPGFP